jgi:hypothetical protein
VSIGVTRSKDGPGLGAWACASLEFLGLLEYFYDYQLVYMIYLHKSELWPLFMSFLSVALFLGLFCFVYLRPLSESVSVSAQQQSDPHRVLYHCD